MANLFSHCPLFTKAVRDRFHKKRIRIYTSCILPFDFRKVFPESSQED